MGCWSRVTGNFPGKSTRLPVSRSVSLKTERVMGNSPGKSIRLPVSRSISSKTERMTGNLCCLTQEGAGLRIPFPKASSLSTETEEETGNKHLTPASMKNQILFGSYRLYGALNRDLDAHIFDKIFILLRHTVIVVTAFRSNCQTVF